MNIDGISCDDIQLVNNGINPLRSAHQSLTGIASGFSDSLENRESVSQAMNGFEDTVERIEWRLKEYCSLLEKEITQFQEARDLLYERDNALADSFQQ